MTITAKRAGRIDVWPSYEIAEQADTETSKFLRRMTIWPTMRGAREHIEFDGGGGEIIFYGLTLGSDRLVLGTDRLVLGV